MLEYYEKEYSPFSFELGNLLYMFDFAINQQQINGYEYDFELLWDEIVAVVLPEPSQLEIDFD